jgi:hypothetical protein
VALVRVAAECQTMPSNPIADNRVRWLLGGVVLLIILGYSLFVASPYLLGPSLTLQVPRPGETITSPTVTITGQTTRVSYLSIDDQAVPLAEDGSFTVERAYPPGYTVIVIRARDRFGREKVDTITFVHNTNPYGKN